MSKIHLKYDSNSGLTNNQLFKYTINGSGATASIIYDSGNNIGIGIQGSGTTALLHLKNITGGSNTSVFKVEGYSGELFTVTDNLIGSLFSVNDISGLPVIEAFDDSTILMGNYSAPSLNTTKKVNLSTGTTTVYSIPTSAYTGGFFEYTLSNTGGVRAGTVMSVWSGTSTQYIDTPTGSIGDTSQVTLSVGVSGSNTVFSASATTTNWVIKTIVRYI